MITDIRITIPATWSGDEYSTDRWRSHDGDEWRDRYGRRVTTRLLTIARIKLVGGPRCGEVVQ